LRRGSWRWLRARVTPSDRLVRSGDARVLGELIDVAVRGAEVDPGVPTFVDSGLIEDLHTGGPQFGGRVLDVVDQEPGDRASGEVAVTVTCVSTSSTPWRPWSTGQTPTRRWPSSIASSAWIHRRIANSMASPQASGPSEAGWRSPNGCSAQMARRVFDQHKRVTSHVRLGGSRRRHEAGRVGRASPSATGRAAGRAQVREEGEVRHERTDDLGARDTGPIHARVSLNLVRTALRPSSPSHDLVRRDTRWPGGGAAVTGLLAGVPTPATRRRPPRRRAR
jgi:hypothetical protein